jgi:arsenical pump membrane protein
MAAPWLATVAVEYLLLRLVFRRDLADVPADTPPPAAEKPVFVLVVLGLTLVGFAVTSFAGLSPAWAALAGAVVLGVRSLAQRRSTIGGITRSLHIPFLVFVLALAVVVKAVMVNGLDHFAADLLPRDGGLAALLGIAALAALLSNIVNNLPAVLVLLPLVAGGGPAAVLAVLIGVNIGPNLTYAGSLSNLLWRRILHGQGESTSVREFTWLGMLTVPACVVAATVALWASFQIV